MSTGALGIFFPDQLAKLINLYKVWQNMNYIFTILNT
jgi:hypothetical protein